MGFSYLNGVIFMLKSIFFEDVLYMFCNRNKDFLRVIVFIYRR